MASESATVELFGKHSVSGEEVHLYTLTNLDSNARLQVINHGAAVRAWKVRNSTGTFFDIVQGYDTLRDYEQDEFWLSCVVGRVANRIGHGKFSCSNGRLIQLPISNDIHHNHGGSNCLSKKVWSCVALRNAYIRLRCSICSEEDGYPGTLQCEVSYELTDENELRIHFEAQVTEECPVSLTSHLYLNLSGHNAGTIADHEVRSHAPTYLPTDSTSLVTGEICSVEGTPFDIRQWTGIDERMPQLQKDETANVEHFEFDNYFCFPPQSDKEIRELCRLKSSSSGLQCVVQSTNPGFQLYSANFLNTKGKAGAKYGKHSSICVEAHAYPNAVNCKRFPNVLLKPGEIYSETTIYRLLIEEEMYC